MTPPPTTEILTHGSDEAHWMSRRGLVALLGAIVALAVGLTVWRLWPAPPAVFTPADVQGVYAGMVRSDGTNDASVIDPGSAVPEQGEVVPSTCAPLFEATVLNRPPHEALDGVGTFWALGPSAVSLFTYRFADIAGADREYTRLARAFDSCRDTAVEVRAHPAAASVLAGVRRDQAQLGYVLTAVEGAKLAVHVLRFSNTVTWQYRYEPVPGPYAPQTAQNVMESLTDQMRSVLDLHHHA
jgi:hypothetical protein